MYYSCNVPWCPRTLGNNGQIQNERWIIISFDCHIWHLCSLSDIHYCSQNCICYSTMLHALLTTVWNKWVTISINLISICLYVYLYLFIWCTEMSGHTIIRPSIFIIVLITQYTSSAKQNEYRRVECNSNTDLSI